uniref:Uncharacterized protein n=1 Tax=Anguilla anguilla TaxID=7936 RepID=A0A0E9XTX7_ANGAN
MFESHEETSEGSRGSPSDLPRKTATLNLLVPLADPAHRAKTLVDPLIPVTWSYILSFVGESLVTPVKVKVVLEAVAGLVRIGETSIKGSGPVVLDLLLNRFSHLH